MVFSENDLKYAYESIGQLSYEKIEEFKNDLEQLDIDNKYISFQNEDVVYAISQDTLDKINAKYDDINYFELIGPIHKN